MESKKSNRYVDILLIAFLLVAVVIFIKRNINASEPKDLTEFPTTKIRFGFDTLISLGKVSGQKPIYFNGYVKNIGDANLHVANFKTSCGCTKFIAKKYIVKPMDSTEVMFTIKPIEQGNDVVNIFFDANTKQGVHKITINYESTKL